MPKPTLENSKFFKEVLKKYRGKFNSEIQTCKLSDLEAMWTTANRSSTAFPTGDPDVKVAMMEGGQNSTPIDISAEVTNQQLVYFPATYGDHCVIKIGDSYHELKFPYDDGPLQIGGNSQTDTGTWQNMALDGTITLRNKYPNGKGFSSCIGTIKAYGGALVDFGGGITAEITAPATAVTVNEGGSVDFTITVTGFTGSASQYFDVVWEGHPNLDFNSSGGKDFTSAAPTYWSFGSSGVKTNTLTLKEDYSANEGSEWFKMKLVDPNDNSIVLAESPIVTVNDTSAGTYSIAISPAGSIQEGSPVTFNVTTTGVPNNTNLYYYIKGTASTSTDFGGANRSGYFLIAVADPSIGIGTGSLTVSLVQDFTADGGEGIYLELYNGYYGSSLLLATSTTVIIDDLPWTATVTSDVTTVQESTSGVTNSVTFTFATTGVPDGTVLRCWIEAVGTNSTFKIIDVYKDGDTWDNVDASNYYDITVNSNAATLKLNVVRDGRTEGDEQFKIVAKGKTSGTTNTIIATSPTVTITDHSIVGLHKTGKTFGPVRVNRDNGTTANASDWYTICKLDQIPNNSKVALFIDTSGSMTMSTIQASYDLLTQKLTARGITYITVQNSQEDWISDFDVAL